MILTKEKSRRLRNLIDNIKDYCDGMEADGMHLVTSYVREIVEVAEAANEGKLEYANEGWPGRFMSREQYHEYCLRVLDWTARPVHAAEGI